MELDAKLWEEFLEKSGMLELLESKVKPKESPENYEKIKEEAFARFKGILAETVENAKISPVDKTVALFKSMLEHNS
ncbi:MAG: hypothetical protein GC192_21435 [Bacteroidetes bacterium]|nr:hypothetical protein [Bacteroidota bacterium]